MTMTLKPVFPPLELDAFDARLDQRAAERGIPTLKSPPVDRETSVGGGVPSTQSRAGEASTGSADAHATPATSVGVKAPVPSPLRRRVPRSSRSRPVPAAPEDNLPTPRARMKPLNVELPDYVWIELKSRAAREMVSVRHIIMTLLQDSGIAIAEVDLIEDGRRLR